LIGVVATLSWRSAHAAAGGADEARAYIDKAATASALAHYDVAAENFEKAFELKPDSAVLYRAAEAHDLAGNKPRALALYRSFLRIYGRTGGSAMIEARIEALEGEAAPGRPPDAAPPAPAFAAPPAQLGDTDPGGATVDLRAERQERVHRRVQWLVLSVVVAGAGTAVAIGSGILELKAESDYNNVPLNDPNHQARLDSLAQAGRRYSLYTNIGVVVTALGLAGVGASVLSLVLLPRERKTAFVLTPAVAPDFAGGVATLRF
jgi:tetratricopeptide (TPR) repeat protein